MDKERGPLSSGVERPDRKADHSAPSNAEVRNKLTLLYLTAFRFVTLPSIL
jgi:hypothetical protein